MPLMTPEDHLKMFGCERLFFSEFEVEYNWTVFKVGSWAQPTLFHGLLLSQLHDLLQSRTWRAGLWKEPSKTSPLAIWLTTSPSSAIDRASLRRGYAASVRQVPNAWDCPVAIGFNFDVSKCGLHGRLQNGVEIRRCLLSEAEVPLQRLHLVECRIFTALFTRYNQLGDVWEAVQRDDRVLCRCRRAHPEDFFSGGHGAPLSCARSTTTPEEDGWMNTARTGTRQWRCPECDRNTRLQLGSVTGE